VLVAWAKRASENEQVFLSEEPFGGTFPATPKQLSRAGEYGFEPRAAFDPQRDVMVAWVGATGEALPSIMFAAETPTGEFSAPRPLSAEGVQAITPAIAITPKGTALVAWRRLNVPGLIEAVTKPANGRFTTPTPISPESASNTAIDAMLGVDAQGDGVASWERFNEGHYEFEVAPYDEAGPLLQGLGDRTAVAGSPVSFSVSPLDVWSALGPTTWSFGDGAIATGAEVSHAYAKEGTYTVTVTSADVLGNATSASATVKVTFSVPKGRPVHGAPVVRNAKQSHVVWREGRGRATISAAASVVASKNGRQRARAYARAARRSARIQRKRKLPVGTTFSFTLDQQARVSFTFSELLSGRKAKGRCVAHTSKALRGRACRRKVMRGAIFFNAHAGLDKVVFQGHMSRSRSLPTGRYQLQIVARNSAKQRSQPVTLSFTIVR
jgi:hypothetical protein